MSTFDSSRYDIPTLVEKLRDQRFDGYDPESLALEVEKFRNGGGTATMGDAVDALKKVAGALSQTDTTLSQQLGALGVAWHSEAGDQANATLAGHAAFSADANTKVSQAAQLIFEQGEAFNRTKNKLPDPGALRQGDGGYTMADTLFSLFGFETDHAANVRKGAEAKAQAVDALNAYAHDSGGYLASSQPVDAPQPTDELSGPGGAMESVSGPTIAPVRPVPPVPSVPGESPTIAAGATDTPAPEAPVFAAAPAPASAAPTPPIGIPAAQQTGSGPTAPAGATAPNAAPPVRTPVTEPISGFVGGSPSRSDQQDTTVRTGPGPVPPAAGPQSGGPGAMPGNPNSAAAWGRPGGGPDGAAARGPAGGGEALLNKGKMFGSVPDTASGAANVGPGLANVRTAGGAGALAEGAPAIGAAGVGGATSGERERERPVRGGDASKRLQQLPVGDLPEEEEALRARKAAPEPPSRERTRAILEPAATQEGEEDDEHVRRFGIDDRDLFTDPRAVSPDLIGDKPLPEE